MSLYNLVISPFDPLQVEIPRIKPLVEGVDRPGVDPLTEPIALTEAVFLSALEDVTYSSLALLFDLRLAIYYADTDWNAGLLICRNVSQLRRDYSHPLKASFAAPKVYHMGDCHVSQRGNSYHLAIDQALEVVCEGLIFLAGSVPFFDKNDTMTSSELSRSLLWDEHIDLRAYSYLGDLSS